jgi:hypothetical protein
LAALVTERAASATYRDATMTWEQIAFGALVFRLFRTAGILPDYDDSTLTLLVEAFGLLFFGGRRSKGDIPDIPVFSVV